MRWIELGALAGLVLACVGVWWVRRPRPSEVQEVSAAWRDEQLRGRRD